jgi:hypothetical protein
VRFPVIIELCCSRRFLLFLAGSHALALLGLWLAVLPLWTKLAASLFLVLSLFHSIRQYTRRQPLALWLYPQGDLGLVLTGLAPPPLPARLETASLVLPWLCVFSWRYDTNVPFTMTPAMPRRGVIVLLPDSADPDSLRRLRVWLRFSV